MGELDKLQGDMKHMGEELDELYVGKKNAAANSVTKMEGIAQGIADSMEDTAAVVEKAYALAERRMSKAKAGIRKAAKTNAGWWEEEENIEEETGKMMRSQASQAEASMEALKMKSSADIALVKGMVTKMNQWVELIGQTRKTAINMMLPLKFLHKRRLGQKELDKKLDKTTKEAQRAWAKLQKVVDNYDTQVSNSFTDWKQALWKQSFRDNKLLGRLRNDVLATTTRSDMYT